MYHSFNIGRDDVCSKEVVKKEIARRRITLLNDDAIIIKNQRRAYGIWIYNNEELCNPVDYNGDLSLSFRYNIDTVDALRKWNFILKEEPYAFIVVSHNDVSIISRFGRELPKGYQAELTCNYGEASEDINIKLIDDNWHRFGKLAKYDTIIHFNDSPRESLKVKIRLNGIENIEKFKSKMKDFPIRLPPGWCSELESMIGGTDSLYRNDIYTGPDMYMTNISLLIENWYIEFMDDIIIELQ